LEAGKVKRLWLLRHLKSSWGDPGLADHDRPLAPRGRKAGKRVRTWAAEHDVRPDLVLCSTALRARETLDLVGPALGEPVVEFEGGIYHAWADDLLERLRRVHPEFDGVLLIGHNPGFHDLARLLAPPGPADFPTGALAELRIATDDWRELRPGGAELVGVVVPRELKN
jgi:phosphohistidine phosphatase